MKRFGLILLACLFTFGLFAQKKEAKRIKLGNKKYIVISEDENEISIKDLDELDNIKFDFDFDDNFKIKKKKRGHGRMNGHWSGLEIGMNTFANSEFEFEYPENVDFMDLNTNKSIGFNLNFGEKNFGIINSYMGLVSGWGLEFNHYSLSNNVTLEDVDGITIGVEDTENTFDKNRLSTCYLTIPLMMEFQIPVTGEHKRLYLSAGVVGGLRLFSRNFQKYKDDDEKVKNKIKDDFNLKGFRYGLTARVGYGDIGFFTTYSMTSLFKDDKGPELYPWTFGITLSH